MGYKEINISESARFKHAYFELLQKVNERFKVKDAKHLRISKSKASRILNGKQFDILVLIELASFSGYDTCLIFHERKNQ